jgi:enterochelin esterase-like enzyme
LTSTRLLLLAILLLALAAGQGARAEVSESACPDSPHRFELLTLYAPALERAKHLQVYMPPGYDCAPSERYPVFYFNDGHDLFDWTPPVTGLDRAVAEEIALREAWYGSWQLDRQLDQAIRSRRLPPMIVVGIAADDGFRSGDLVPVPWRGWSDARGVAFGRFVAETEVPTIDRRFRTLPEPRCRGIGGASLGAVSALHIGLAHPGRFGLILALSPVLADQEIAGDLAARWQSAGPDRPATLIDFDDDAAGQADRGWFTALTRASPGAAPMIAQTPGGRHRLASWAERVIPGLERLLTADCVDATL